MKSLMPLICGFACVLYGILKSHDANIYGIGFTFMMIAIILVSFENKKEEE